MTNNKFINKYCISYKKKIIDVIQLFEKSKTNILIVVDSKKKFVGIVTSTDLRRGILRGLSNSSPLKSIINQNPLLLKEKINENKISNIISSDRFNKIDPPFIPILNKENKPIKIVNKDLLNIDQYDLNNKKVKTKILLIGGAGYIGSILAKKLLKQNYQVTIFDKFIYQSQQEIRKKIKSNNLKLVKGDSRRIDEVFEVIKKNNVVVHLAELVGDPLCEVKPSKTYEVNFLCFYSYKQYLQKFTNLKIYLHLIM